MGGLFSKGTKDSHPGKSKSKTSESGESSITDKDRAVLDLKNARDRLKKYRKKVHLLLRLPCVVG
jgi:hypothetical protein